MASPVWKVYAPGGDYVASCKYAEDAAAVVALRGKGAKIVWDHTYTVWTEGVDGCAGDSYDHVAAVARDRVLDRLEERSLARRKARGEGSSR